MRSISKSSETHEPSTPRLIDFLKQYPREGFFSMLGSMKERRTASGEERSGPSAAETIKVGGRGPKNDCVCEGLGWVYKVEDVQTIGGSTFPNFAHRVRCPNVTCKYREIKLNPKFIQK